MSLSSEFDRSFRVLVSCGVAKLCRLVRAYEEAMWLVTQHTPGLRTDDDKPDPVGWAYMLGYFDITFEGGGEMRATRRSDNITVLAVTKPLPSFAVDAWKELRSFLEEQGVLEQAPTEIAAPEEAEEEPPIPSTPEELSDLPVASELPDMPPAWRDYSELLRQGYEPQEIAQMKNVEVPSINQAVSRARKEYGEELFPKREARRAIRRNTTQ